MANKSRRIRNILIALSTPLALAAVIVAAIAITGTQDGPHPVAAEHNIPEISPVTFHAPGIVGLVEAYMEWSERAQASDIEGMKAMTQAQAWCQIVPGMWPVNQGWTVSIWPGVKEYGTTITRPLVASPEPGAHHGVIKMEWQYYRGIWTPLPCHSHLEM